MVVAHRLIFMMTSLAVYGLLIDIIFCLCIFSAQHEEKSLYLKLL